jgi:MYXO-CTERM domain-containing protein
MIAFTAPVLTGDGPVTTYTAKCDPGAVTVTGATSPLTLAPLVNGTLYTCAVAASNAYGMGPTSGTVTVTPIDPDPPPVDAGPDAEPDASIPDAAPVADASSGADSSADAAFQPPPPAGGFDAGSGPPSFSFPIGGGDEDCGCHVIGRAAGPSSAVMAAAALLGLAVGRRRRRSR